MFYEQLEALCKEINTTPTNFVKTELNLSSSKVTAWKNGSIPKYEILNEIADYFNVTVGYLFDGGKKSSLSELTENEREIVKIFKDLTDTQQGIIIGRALSLAEYNNNDYSNKERVSL